MAPKGGEMRKRFLRWLISVLLPGYHLSRNPVGSGRKKKVEMKNEK